MLLKGVTEQLEAFPSPAAQRRLRLFRFVLPAGVIAGDNAVELSGLRSTW